MILISDEAKRMLGTLWPPDGDVLRLVLRSPEADGARELAFVHSSGEGSDQIVQHAGRQVLRIDRSVRRGFDGSRFDDSAEVGRISSPTLVIHGSEDRYVPSSNARDLAEAIPNAKLRILEGAGHLVFIERAAEVNMEVSAFLGEGGPSVASGRTG